MAQENNYTENIEELIRRHEERVLGELFPEIKNKSIEKHGDLVIMRGVGNPSTNHYLVKNVVEGREYAFAARFYSIFPQSYKGPLSLPLKDFKSYQFLREAGIIVPRVVFLEDAPRWLFIEYIPGETLREIIEKTSVEQRKIILEDMARRINDFQKTATAYTFVSPEETKETEKIFWARDIDEQTIDYLTLYLGDETEATHVAKQLYLPLFKNVLKGREIVHGDLSPDNVIRQESGVDYWIDCELKRRNRFAGLGSFLSYIGNFEKVWDRLTEIFASTENEAKAREARFGLYSNISFYSLRIVAKRKARSEKSYEEQERNIQYISNMFITNPKDFGLTDEKTRMAEELGKYLRRNNNSGTPINLEANHTQEKTLLETNHTEEIPNT